MLTFLFHQVSIKHQDLAVKATPKPALLYWSIMMVAPRKIQQLTRVRISNTCEIISCIWTASSSEHLRFWLFQCWTLKAAIAKNRADIQTPQRVQQYRQDHRNPSVSNCRDSCIRHKLQGSGSRWLQGWPGWEETRKCPAPLQTIPKCEILNNPLHQNVGKSEEHMVPLLRHTWERQQLLGDVILEGGTPCQSKNPSFKQVKNKHQTSEIGCKMRLNRLKK